MIGVASGVGDAYFATGPKSEWDVCAAAVIVEESGGRVTDLDGEDLRFNRESTDMRGVVCASEEDVHAQLIAWLRGGWR
jgi:myo-inositol-1(or 4)-monophosphatase